MIKMNLQQNLKDGLAGVMRVRDEERLLESCIDSCINALDELIVVYHDCTDSTPEILERKQKEYPDKLKVYDYKHKVLSFDLTEDEFNEALSLPDNSARLYANLCNYGFSKSHYKFATKIDTDQIYFEDELKKWRDVCAKETNTTWGLYCVVGWLFMMYFTLYRRLSFKLGNPCLWMLPDWLVVNVFPYYRRYAERKMLQGKASIALSGINLFKDGKWYIPFDKYNNHHPYNGLGDTLIFKLSEDTYFLRYINEKSRSVTEGFTNPFKMMFAGPIWFHQHANRYQCFDKIKQVKDSYPDLFIPIDDFLKMSYKEVHAKMDEKAHSLYQRIFFALVHKVGIKTVSNHMDVIEKYGIK